MCLSLIESKKEVLKRNGKLKRKWFYCYSVGVTNGEEVYRSRFHWECRYKLGLNIAKISKLSATRSYTPYFHRFFTLKDAVEYRGRTSELVVLKWKVYVKDISTCGKQIHRDVLVAEKMYLIGHVSLKGKPIGRQWKGDKCTRKS